MKGRAELGKLETTPRSAGRRDLMTGGCLRRTLAGPSVALEQGRITVEPRAARRKAALNKVWSRPSPWPSNGLNQRAKGSTLQVRQIGAESG